MKKAMIAPILFSLLFIAVIAGYAVLFFVVPIPFWIQAAAAAAGAALIAVMIYVLIQRKQEIEEEDEDDFSKY